MPGGDDHCGHPSLAWNRRKMLSHEEGQIRAKHNPSSNNVPIKQGIVPAQQSHTQHDPSGEQRQKQQGRDKPQK